MIFEVGKYYRYTKKVRPDFWNISGKMDYMLDGKPRRCISAKNSSNAKFSDSDETCWNWDIENFEEVPNPEYTEETDFKVGDIVECITSDRYSINTKGNGTGKIIAMTIDGIELEWINLSGKNEGTYWVDKKYFRKVEQNKEIKIGDIVEIVDAGEVYSSYRDMAKILKSTKWKDCGWHDGLRLKTGTVINIHENISIQEKYVLIDIGSEEIIIGIKGIKKIGEQKIENSKGEQKMELKDVKQSNLVEAKKQFDIAKANEEVEFAKQQLRIATDKINEYDRQIKQIEEYKKPYLETLAKFK